MHHRRALASLAFLTVAAAAQDPPRSAKAILREFDRVAMPSMSDGSDPDSARRFRAAIAEGCRRKAELAAELQRVDPTHARLPSVLAIRWAGLTNALGKADEVASELETLLQGDLRDDVRNEAVLALARARVASDSGDNLKRLEAVQAAMKLDTNEDLAASCLLDLCQRHIADPVVQRSLLEAAVARWPDSAYGGRPAKRWLHVAGSIGRPFRPLLPENLRTWFAEVAGTPAEFTVVQTWTGWVPSDGEDEEIAALSSMRRELGARVRLVGLLNGDLDERLPAARAAGVDWPQAALPDPEPMTAPFGAPRVGFYFVLDREQIIVGVVGRATLVRERIRQLDAAAKAAVR